MITQKRGKQAQKKTNFACSYVGEKTLENKNYEWAWKVAETRSRIMCMLQEEKGESQEIGIIICIRMMKTEQGIKLYERMNTAERPRQREF